MEEQFHQTHAIELQTVGFEVIDNLKDDSLMLEIYRNRLLELLDSIDPADKSIFYYGEAPDNDGAGEDELLYNGVIVRLIAKDIALPLSEESPTTEIIHHFKTLVEYAEACFYTVFEEQGETKKQTTVEFMF